MANKKKCLGPASCSLIKVPAYLFFQAHFGFECHAQHVVGRMNVTTEALLRNMLDVFFLLCPQASHS